MKKWYRELTEKEQNRINDIAEARVGFLRSGETANEYKTRKAEHLDKVIEEKYNQHLREKEFKMEQEEMIKEAKQEEERTHQENLEKGIATIELYESNKYRCWAAEVTGLDSQYGFARSFINPSKIQGNYKIYKLKEGKLYNYLNDNKQHYVKVVNSKLIEITEDEMKELV